MSGWSIRSRRPDDDDRLVAINQANEPEVGPLDPARLALFAAEADAWDVVELGGELVGLFVGLTQGCGYDSANYRWFAARRDRFAYVDRIALQPAARGLGVADALYDRFESRARAAGIPVLCAEVNTVPPNPRSLRFHERRGFVVVGEEAPYGGHERVAMVEKSLTESAGGAAGDRSPA